MKAFREVIKNSRHILVLSGAGISAESGIPTFRGQGGFWRKYQATDLATMDAFERNSSLVWEFYSYRREVAKSKEPNAAHLAIAQLEKRLEEENKGRTVTVVTQNIDRLHHRAGSKNILELHGTVNGEKNIIRHSTYHLFLARFSFSDAMHKVRGNRRDLQKSDLSCFGRKRVCGLYSNSFN